MSISTPSETSTQQPIHPYWYATGFVSALIMGLSAFVIAYNFMIGQAPLLIVIACSLSGLILNTTLYWSNSAEKLEFFFTQTINAPKSLLSWDAWINFASAACVGFLAMHSYLEQSKTLIPTHLYQFIPVWPLIVFFSGANAISTFVLFYEPKSESETTALYHSIKSALTFSNIKKYFQNPINIHLANIIGITQSLMFSLTNLWCVQSVIYLLAPQISQVSLIASIPMSLALLYSECKFNCEKMQKILENDAPTYWSAPALQSSLYALICLNGFANGWIALGELHQLPLALKWIVVGIGSTVSFSVMKSSLSDINKVIFYPRANQFRFIPLSNADKVQATIGMAKMAILSFGAYIIAYPLAWQYILTAAPTIAYPLLCGFIFTFVSCAMDGSDWAQKQLLDYYTKIQKTPKEAEKSQTFAENKTASTPMMQTSPDTAIQSITNYLGSLFSRGCSFISGHSYGAN